MMNDERFDQLLDSLRSEPETDTTATAAKARVWEKLAVSASTTGNPACAEFRAELPAYAGGQLLESRRLLVEDHLSRCVECRKVLAQQAGNVVEMPRLRTSGAAWSASASKWSRWAIAAGVAAFALYASRDRLDAAFAPAGARATVEMVAGELRGPQGVLKMGASLQEGELVRTGPGSRAVLRLADGSALEMNQQVSLTVHAAWSGQTVQLDSGDVIVQAAKQRRGRLRVRTRDSVASVKGTIFAVSTGLAGSLVAVAEGAVEVEQGSAQDLLKPGQRKASSKALSAVTTQEAFAWSQNAEQYLALLADFAKIEQQLAMAPQNSRREARLLPSLPAQPVVYGAIPNLGSSLSRAVEDQLRQSATLRSWWESADGKQLRQLLETMNTITPHLGDEVVFVLSSTAAPATTRIPVLLAEVKAGQRATLEQSLAKLTGGIQGFTYRVTDKLLIASDSVADLTAASATMGQGAATPFAQEIARRYQRGAGWLLALNLEPMVTNHQEAALFGADAVKHAFFEQRMSNGSDQNEAALTFNGTRRGIPSWLAAPAPAASAEYVSSDAVVAFSAVTKSPRAAFDEFVAILSRVQPSFAADLKKLEADTGIRIGDDIAAALGADFTFAIETPTLPMPGWTWSVEVLRPSTLDGTILRLVDLANTKITDPKQRMALTQESANGRSWKVLKSSGMTLYWTYDRGYLVASADRAVALKALNTRNGGFPLIRSASFRERLPVSSTMHQSAFLWVNASQALQQLAVFVPALKAFAGNRNPVLMTLNGESDRIVASSRTRLTSLLLDLAAAAQPAATGAGAKGKEQHKKAAGDEDDDEE